MAEGKSVIIDGTHAERRSFAFAALIGLGLLLILAVWLVQLRGSLRDAHLSHVAAGLTDFASDVKDAAASAPTPSK